MPEENPIKIDPEIMHGTPCFSGTRVPVSILFDYLSENRTIDFFLEQYPTVRREQVIGVIERAGEILSHPAQPSKVA
jgi:uncharacterized protein (DUF433 family)